MAIIAPFKGLTYNYYARQDFEAIVAPPYDVISEEEREVYYQKDPYNVIRLILAKKKIGDSDWDNRYTRAADCFKRWESSGILLPSDRPSIYLNSLTYDPGNGDPLRTRWGIIALVRIEDEDARVILPHERTFSAHRDDRLKLMRACSAQLSQIFGLYEESDNTVIEGARKVADFPPEIAFDFEDGTSHRIWVIQNPRVFKNIADVMRNKSIFIADGHHRYETARNYRNIMRARHGHKSLKRSYEYVMMYLSNMSDEGLTILPSHRLVKEVPDIEPGTLLERVGKWFGITSFPFKGNDISKECADLKQKLKEAGRQDTVIAFYHTKSDQCYLLSLKPGARGQLGDDLHASLKKLDVLVLSRFILQKGIGLTKQDLDNDEIIHYQSNMTTAVSQVRSGDYQMAFLLNPTKIEHVQEIANNSLVMPRKSTYFYPKILTGLVFNKVNPKESVHVP
ncbi:MAG: DUF1015 domain-containing protein [Deltaproteobacteria bacterium]|nr:DUF1015 domain-containing protein [Deltaproteobacteria bacterium]